MKEYSTSNSTYYFINQETKEKTIGYYYITQPETQADFLNQNQEIIPNDSYYAPIRNRYVFPIFLKEKPY